MIDKRAARDQSWTDANREPQMSLELSSLFDLNGRTVLVTGASRGIGASLAAGLASFGARVYGIARSAQPDEPPAEGVTYQSCDVTDETALIRLCDGLAERHGAISVLVNAAGVSPGGGTMAAFDETLAVNLRAPYLACRTVAEYMKTSGGGSIINVTSLGSVLGFPGNPGYQAAKGGLRMLTRAMAYDLGPYFIRVNNLAPGYIRSAMTERSYSDPVEHERRLAHMMLPRWGMPADLIGAAVFLASDASAYVTGQDLFVDGGWTAKGL